MVKCIDVVKNFNNPPVNILKSISLDISKGEFVGITGRSGSGKSTLLYIISSLDNPTSGKVLLDGQDVHSMNQKDIHAFRNRRIGFVFQFHYLLPELTALENILMPARKCGEENIRSAKAVQMIEDFNLIHCKDKLPSQMSGGELQRTSIVRSLIMEPAILFADEPTGNLDSENGDRVMQLFHKVNREYKTTILMVTHENDYAMKTSRQLHMSDGVIISDSSIKTKGKRK